jgi:hypothetical protein
MIARKGGQGFMSLCSLNLTSGVALRCLQQYKCISELPQQGCGDFVGADSYDVNAKIL